MSTEYIERGKFERDLQELKAHAEGGSSPQYTIMLGSVLALLHHYPAADVEPVVHARWEECDLFDWKYFKCTNCGETISGFPTYPYCHICGAHMDERSDEK